MADYCEKETIYKTLYNKLYDEARRSAGERSDFCFEIMDKLKSWCDEIITADVRENVRGEWVFEEQANQHRCSVCGCDDYGEGQQDGTVWFNHYCPNCGADMKPPEVKE